MNSDADVVVVGGGPAGAAAAIWAALGGLRVNLFERSAFPRHRPGETLHPGVGSILGQLGVENQVAAASEIRHPGHGVIWGGIHRFVRFGADEHGEWRGYQILRERFDSILVARAVELGVEVSQPCAVTGVIMEDGRAIGVAASGIVRAPFVIDASGGRSWLSRQIGEAIQTASPPLRAYYGYCEGGPAEPRELPLLAAEDDGWTWIAEVGERKFHWTRMSFTNAEYARRPPPGLEALRQTTPIRGADVTWRRVTRAANRGYFVVGDAAVVLDPSASHGVLRALMSGMKAAHAVRQILARRVDEDFAIREYCDWIARWYQDDLDRMAGFYRYLKMPPPWVGGELGGKPGRSPYRMGMGPLLSSPR
jgi:flavin-dependent dehydrogenase